MKKFTLLMTTLLLSACGFFGEGDNAPLIFDNEAELTARADRRTTSPAPQIYGQRYEVVDAVIEGRASVPGGTKLPHVKFEDHDVRGSDGCYDIKGGGIFTPSGYEFSMMDSGAFKTRAFDCDGGLERWMDMYELENRVWKLSLDGEVLTLSDYNDEGYLFRLRPLQ